MSDKTKPWSKRAAMARKTPDRSSVSFPPVASPRPAAIQCTKKKAYYSPAIAKRVVLRAEGSIEGMAVRMYTCPHCGAIHVGHYAV